MAVHQGSGGNDRNNETPREEARPRREEPRFEREQSTRRTGTLKDVNRLLGSAISRNTGGEVLSGAMKSFREWLQPDKNVGGNGLIDLSKMQVLPLESTEHNTQISAVIFAYPAEKDGQLNVYTHVAALAGSFEGDLPIRQVDIQRRQYPVPAVIGDYVTDGFLRTAQEIAEKAFADNRRQVNVLDAGWRVVSDRVDFNLTDNSMVRQVAFYAVAALNALVTEDFDPDLYFDLGWLVKGENLDISIDLSGREVLTADGLPRRSDLVVNISGNIQAEDQQLRSKLTSLGGYMNLVYSPDDQDSDLSRRRREENTQVYTPVFVIDNIDTGINAITPELLLLGLAGGSVLSRRTNWAQVYLPNDRPRDDVDYRDVGFLALLGQDRRVVEINGSRTNLDTDKWADYFFSLVREELAWGIEVEEGGDNSWITSLLWAAAMGDRNSEERLWNYADRLTNGHFSRRASDLGVNRFVVDSGARYLTGTYVDDKGELRDLRDFDLLRWLVQTGNDDPNIALDWQDTFDNLDIDQEIRISEQYRMLQSVLGNNLKAVRYVNLLYIEPDAIQALAEAVNDCGVGIDQNQTLYTFGSRRLRGNSRIRDLAAGDVSGGIFNRSRSSDDGRRGRRNPLFNGFGRRNF